MIQLRYLLNTMVLPVKSQCLNAPEQRELRRFLEYPDATHGCPVQWGGAATGRRQLLQQLVEKQYIALVSREAGVEYFRLRTD